MNGCIWDALIVGFNFYGAERKLILSAIIVAGGAMGATAANLNVGFATKIKILEAKKKLVTQEEFLKVDKSKGVTLAIKAKIFKGSFYDMGCKPSVWKQDGYACFFADIRNIPEELDFEQPWSRQKNRGWITRFNVFRECDCTIHAKSNRLIKDFNLQVDRLSDRIRD